MKNIKNSSGASQPQFLENPNRLSTDVYLAHLDKRMHEIRGDIVGKVLTFIEAISDNEQVTKARKDVVSGILYEGLNKIVMQPEYEMEWLERSIYSEETLKNNFKGHSYIFQLATSDSNEYDGENVVKPNKI